MASNYRILNKAKLANDLFVGEMDESASAQEQADRDWARDQERDVFGSVEAPAARRTSAAGKAAVLAVEPPLETETGEPPTEEAEIQAPESGESAGPELVEAAQPRTWTQMLADFTQDPRLEGIRCLGVCGIDRHSGATDATVALARWAAQHCDRPALIVEAHFREPRHAERFDARESGLAEALLGERPVEELIQEAAHASNLQMLTAGAPFGWFRRRKAVSAFPLLLSSLRERYETIIVELPAADDPVMKQVGALADAVILVADSKTTSPGKLQRAADRLRKANVSLAAAMPSLTEDLSAALRRQRLAEQVRAGAA